MERNVRRMAALAALLAAGAASAQSSGPFGGPPQEQTKEMRASGINAAAQPLPSQLSADQRGMKIYRMQDLPALPDGKTPMAGPAQSWPNGSGDTLPPFGMPGQPGPGGQAQTGPLPLPAPALPSLPQAGAQQQAMPAPAPIARLEAVFPGKRPTASAAGRLVSTGSKIGGSRIASIDRDGVTLANGRTISVGDPLPQAEGTQGGEK